MKKSLLGLSLLTLGLAGSAYAAAAMPGDPLGDKTVTLAEFLAKGAEMFARMDVNKDGKLDQTDRAAHDGEMFDRIDPNHDGKLSREEFMAAHHRRPGARGAGDAAEGMPAGGHRGGHEGGMRLLRMADTNHDGAVTRDEFMAAQTKLFQLMDADHDGQLTKAERLAARQKMHAMGGMGGKMHHGSPRGRHPMGDLPAPPPPAN